MNTSDHLKASVSSLQNAIAAKKEQLSQIHSRQQQNDQEKKDLDSLYSQTSDEIEQLQQQAKTLENDIKIAQSTEKSL